MRLVFETILDDGKPWKKEVDWPEKEISIPTIGENYRHPDIGSRTVKSVEWDIGGDKPFFVINLQSTHTPVQTVPVALVVRIDNENDNEEFWEKVIKWPSDKKLPQAEDDFYLGANFAEERIVGTFLDQTREPATYTIDFDHIGWDDEYDGDVDMQREWLANQGFVKTY